MQLNIQCLMYISNFEEQSNRLGWEEGQMIKVGTGRDRCRGLESAAKMKSKLQFWEEKNTEDCKKLR